jgi:ubiquitin-protein ligase
MKISSDNVVGAIIAVVLGGAFAFYFFIYRGKKRPSDQTTNGSQFMTEELKRKRLARLQQPSSLLSADETVVSRALPSAPHSDRRLSARGSTATVVNYATLQVTTPHPISPSEEADNSRPKEQMKPTKTVASVGSSDPVDLVSIPPAGASEAQEGTQKPPRFQLSSKALDSVPLTLPEAETEAETVVDDVLSSAIRKTTSPRKQIPVSAQKQVTSLITGLLQSNRHSPHVTTVKLINTQSTSACRLVKGALVISVCISEEEQGNDRTPTLHQYIDHFDSSGSSFLARDVLESCLPRNGNNNNNNVDLRSVPTLKLQLEWLNKVHSLCDPLNGFSRDTLRIFDPPSPAGPPEDETSHELEDPVLLGRALVAVFRAACVSLGQTLLAPHDEKEAIVHETVQVEDDNDDLPPLFAGERVETSSRKAEGAGEKTELGCTLYDMMHQQLLTSTFFCEIAAEFFGVLRALFARAMQDITAATTAPCNVFTRTDCDLFSAFPVASLDVLLAAAPALGRLLVRNVTACNVLEVASSTSTSTSTGSSITGVDLMNTFLLTELFCVTRALSLPPTLSFNPCRAVEPWTVLLQSKEKNRLINARLDDIDRIIQRVRRVTLDIFKHALAVDKGRNKKDMMEFFTLVLALATKRTLGRHDDPHEIARGFEPEGCVLSRHFVYGTVDLITQLLAHGGSRVFNIDSFLERRQKELADVTVVQPLVSGALCKCNFDVFLLFSSLLFTSALDREVLRQHYVMDEMRRLLKHSRITTSQREQLEGYLQAYHLSSSCQASRAESIVHTGTAADMFTQFLLQLIHSPTASECFQCMERSPHNVFMSLSFMWTTLTRIPRPAAEQVAAAERVVYLSCTLLNRPDLLSDVKQQSHWVNILNSICGNIADLEDGDEFEDDCVEKKEPPPSATSDAPDAWGTSKWKRNSPSKHHQAKSAYFGPSRGPYVGAIFDSERNVRALPVALARLYISCQSVEDWDADRDKSFSKFALRQRLGHLLTACIDHPLHSEAVLDSLSKCQYTADASLIETLFMSAIDHNTSNIAFLIKIIEVAKSPEDVKNKYFSVKFARQGMKFLLKLCGKNTVLASTKVGTKLSNQVLQLIQTSALISNSIVELGLNGTGNFLDAHIHQLTCCMESLGGDAMMQMMVECCVDKGVRLYIKDDKTGLNELVAYRWQQEDACRAQHQVELLADADSDDQHFLTAEVKRALGDEALVTRYHDAVNAISNAIESVDDIPGYKFEKIARDSREKGGSARRLGVVKAWKQVAKCLKNANGDNSFHPNGTILIKCLGTDASCARAVISVNAETPYAFGLFFFDIWLPPDYPLIPPLCELITTGGGSVMLSPNLYTCGKVCMSLLNTAQSSSDIEKWQPDKSTVAQVLLTIQASLLGDSEPMTKEGKARGSPLSLAYNEDKHFETVRWGMLDALLRGGVHMGDEFGAFIVCHFSQLRREVRYMVRSWWLSGRRNERIERVFIALLRELKKLPALPGEDTKEGVES